MGLAEADVALVERLVRHHLTLAELATRRDHADPATLAALVDAVDGRLETLNLLRRPDRGRLPRGRSRRLVARGGHS